MRTTWLTAWAAAGLAAGCAGFNGSLPLGGMAANSASANGGQASPSQQATWAERLKAPFKHNPLAKLGSSGQGSKQSSVFPPGAAFDPDKATPELYVAMAQMSHRGGNVPQARHLYQKALAMEPRHLEALLGAARMEDREGQLDVAIMLYQRTAAAHPRNATVANDLALCFARRGDLPAAQRALEHAVRLEPSKALYRNNLAKVLVEMNRLDEATRQLAAVHPPAVAYYNMGVLLSQRGRHGESAHYLSQALAIDPTIQPARALLSQIMAPAPGALPGTTQALVQTPPPSAPVAVEPPNNDSILPTPEVVAVIPWAPPGSTPAVAYPTTGMPGPGESASAGGPNGQTPSLLPPIN